MLILEIVTCDVFLKSQEKGSYEENILNEASKRSGLATEHLRETLFSLVKASTSDQIVPARSTVMPLITFQTLMTSKLLLSLRANLITKMNLLILRANLITKMNLLILRANLITKMNLLILIFPP